MKLTDARSRKSLLSFGAAALLAIGAATAQIAAIGATDTLPGAEAIDNTGNYQHEVQSCLSGHTQQDRATCLREARNAKADKDRGRLENYATNMQARCNALSGDDKAACQARMLGYGSVEGSVAGGGLLREVETVQMPAGASQVTVEPKTADPVVVLPQK